jgi:DNA-binding MarR family transcriptional regulator
MAPKEKRAVSGLEDHLGYWLRKASNHASHAFRWKLEDRGATVAEWVVLRSLWDEGEVAPSQIAERLSLTRGAVSKLVDRLVAKKLVVCRVDRDDRRFQTLALTPAGRKLVPTLAGLADRNDQEFFGVLSDEQRSTLAALLKELVRSCGATNIPID